MSGKFIKFFLLSAIAAILIAYFFKPIVTYLHVQFGLFSEHRYVVTIQAPNQRVILPYQFEGPAGPFVLVTRSYVPLYAHFSSQKPLQEGLALSQRVRPVFLTIFESVSWVFIQDESGQHDLGWVKRSDLGFKNQFLPVKTWSYSSFTYKRKGYHAVFQSDFKGDFTVEWEAKSAGLHLVNQGRGHFYRFGDVIWAYRTDFEAMVEFFCIGDNDQLLPEAKYRKMSRIIY